MRAWFVLFVLLLPFPVNADDGAASIAAGGLVLMKREPRITMAKEVLQISPTKVVVDYDFRNDSDQDITTAVAFPIAPYTASLYTSAHEEAFSGVDSEHEKGRINSFKLMVDGKQVPFRTAAKALLKGRDYGPKLRAMHIDPATFGHAGDDLYKLDASQRAQFVKHGLISASNFPDPLWTVDLRYYWRQNFPTHKTIHIHHEYLPITGESQIPPNYFPGQKFPKYGEDTARELHKLIGSTCLSAHDATKIAKIVSTRPSRNTKNMNAADSNREYFSHLVLMNYVDFILTTANTWKQPIEDFTLIVNPKPYATEPAAKVYFCPDTSLEGANGAATTFHATNFTPTHELRIGFYRY